MGLAGEVLGRGREMTMKTGLQSESDRVTEDDRRRWQRIRKSPETDHATIRFRNQSELVVEVYDESIGGLGVLVDGKPDFECFDELEIHHNGELIIGTVMHIDLMDNEQYLVGFHCERLP